MERIRITTVAVFGLGALVALAAGVPLYVSGIAGMRNTQSLLAEQSEALLDTIERRLDRLLEPVVDQGAWISAAFARGEVSLERPQELDAYMLGALAATPQVASLGMGTPDARLTRWPRDARLRQQFDWSNRAEFVQWTRSGRTRETAGWRSPIWSTVIQSVVLLHDVPLRREGRYVGMLAQTVPIAGLSRELTNFSSAKAVTAFVVYGEDRVLAHPHMDVKAEDKRSAAVPMLRLSEFGDPVLAQLHNLERPRTFSPSTSARAEVGEVEVDGTRFLMVYRVFGRFGPEPWIVGAYANLDASGLSSQMRRLRQALLAGFGVLVVAVVGAGYLGRRFSRPIHTFSRAARSVRLGQLDDVPVLERSAIKEFDEANRSFNEMVRDLRERTLVRATLGRFVSEHVASELLSGGGRIEPSEVEASVLVCDVEGFTPLTQLLGPVRVVEFLNAYFESMVEILERHGGVITQFQGDAILAVFNVPLPDTAHARHAVEAAIEMVAATDAQPYAGIQTRNRIGISTGQVVAGAVGARGRLSYTVHGNAVNLASRLEELNKSFGTRILVAPYTVSQCEGLAFESVTKTEVRGYSDPVDLFTPRGTTPA